MTAEEKRWTVDSVSRLLVEQGLKLERGEPVCTHCPIIDPCLENYMDCDSFIRFLRELGVTLNEETTDAEKH